MQLLVKNFIELDFPTQPDTYRHLSYKDRICSENIPIQLTGCQMSCSYRFPLESYFKIRHFNSKTRVQNRSVALLFFTNFVPPKVCLFLDRSCTIFSWKNLWWCYVVIGFVMTRNLIQLKIVQLKKTNGIKS